MSINIYFNFIINYLTIKMPGAIDLKIIVPITGVISAIIALLGLWFSFQGYCIIFYILDGVTSDYQERRSDDDDNKTAHLMSFFNVIFYFFYLITIITLVVLFIFYRMMNKTKLKKFVFAFEIVNIVMLVFLFLIAIFYFIALDSDYKKNMDNFKELCDDTNSSADACDDNKKVLAYHNFVKVKIFIIQFGTWFNLIFGGVCVGFSIFINKHFKLK